MTLLDFSFQDPRSCWLVKIGDFQNVCSVDPVVLASSHNLLVIYNEFVYGHLLSVSDILYLFEPAFTYTAICSRVDQFPARLSCFGGRHCKQDVSCRGSANPIVKPQAQKALYNTYEE